MDKYEYREKTEQMMKYVEAKSYREAKEIADTIDWRRVKNAPTLCTVSEIYECNADFEKSREILFIAYDRSPGSRKIVYRLGTLALRLGETDEAMDCYEEFVRIAPKDPNQYILKYKIQKEQGAPIEEQIKTLEEFKKAEYIEKWAYELAELYDRAGMAEECMEECDDLILWFSEGVYVQKAMELKMKHKPLTPQQQGKYDRAEEKREESVQEQKEDWTETILKAADTTETLEDAFWLGMAVASKKPIDEVKKLAGKGEEDVYETGRLKIEEILQQWEEKQRRNAEIIEEKRREAEQKAAEEKQKVSGNTEKILSDDIQKLLAEMESEDEKNGVTAEPEDEVSQLSEVLKEESDEDEMAEEQAKVEETAEESGETAEEEEESEEEYPEEEYDEEEYPEEEYDEEEYPEEEYDEEEYPEEEYVEEEYPEEEYDEEEYPEEEYDEEEYPEEEYDEEEYSEEEYDEEEYPEEEYDEEQNEEEDIFAKVPETEEVLEIEEPDEEDATSSSPGGVSFDTGFVVQGRYDLSATSEIGLKAGLTEEQKKLFSYFVPIRGMSEQIVHVLEQDKTCKKRYGTSRTGNILVIGHKGSGKTVLAVDLVKAIQKQRKMKQGKVAIITGDALNQKNLEAIIQKLQGGALIIEKACKMNKKTLSHLSSLMEEQTGEMLFILEEERRPLEKMLSANPDFKRKFTSRVELPIFINDELVTFGQTYAKENGYTIDEMGILALYSRIDVMQKEDHFVTVAEVKEIMDEAIAHSQKANVKHLMKRVFRKSTDESDRIILKEDDFK